MRKSLFAFVLVAMASLALLVPSAGLAQYIRVPGNDVIGIYTTSDGNGFAHVEGLSIGSQFSAYLLITNCQEPSGIAAFECQITIEAGGAIAGSITFPVPAINVGSATGELLVGFGAIVPRADVIHLATIPFFFLGPETMTVVIGPVNPASAAVPGQMSYSKGNDVGSFVEMIPSSGAFDSPVFGANTGSLGIPVESTTWGGVKDLYK